MPLPSFNHQNTKPTAPQQTQQPPVLVKQQAVFTTPNSVPTTSTTATHSLHDEFNATYQACLSKFDNWAATKKNEINSLRGVHRKQVADLKEKLAIVQQQQHLYQEKEAQIVELTEKETKERTEAEFELQTLESQQSTILQTRAKLLKEIDALHADTTERKKVLNEARIERQTNIDKILPEWHAYKDILSWDIESPSLSIIRFSFTNINPANPSQVYILKLNIQGKAYNVDGCLPMIDGMKELLDEVNESRNLYGFLKKVRLGFVELASSK
jgi:kinetochore protein Spc25